MEKQKSKIFKLLKNIHFVQWIQSPNQESRHYWSKWISNHPDRKEDVDLARHFIQSSQLRSDVPISEQSYDRILENIVSHSLTAKDKEEHFINKNWKPLSIAATIALVIFLSVYTLWIDSNDAAPLVEIATIQKEAPLGSKVTTRLPDGSIVTLNSGTIIKYPEKFTHDRREIELNGEAFFEVEHNPNKPFYVRMNGDQVRVLGTSFNIRSYSMDSIVHVSVATGRVAYTIPSGEQVVLTKDQMATYLPNEERLTTGEVDKLQAFGWRDRILYFKSTAFEDIVIELERWYGVEIDVRGDFESRGSYSGEFRNVSLSEVLNGLSFIYRFNFNIEDNKVILRNITT